MNRMNRAEAVRFLLTGGLNTLVGFGLYAGLVMAGVEPALALLAATLLGVAFNFFSFGHLTFRRLELWRLPRFVLAYCAIYAGNLALLWAVQRAFGLGPVAAQLLCLLVVAPAAYLLLSTCVFALRP